jgi:hypothetical protein
VEAGFNNYLFETSPENVMYTSPLVRDLIDSKRWVENGNMFHPDDQMYTGWVEDVLNANRRDVNK